MTGTDAAPNAKALLRRRQFTVLENMTAAEAPRVLYLIVLIIVVFDLGYASVGIIAPFFYYVSDVAQSIVHLTAAILMQRRVIPAKWAPAAFMVAVVANNMATTYQATIVGEGALGVIALMLAVAGAVAHKWRPFLIGSAVCTAVTGTTLYLMMNEVWLTWFITMITAVAVSAVVLYGRYESALDLAQAQAENETLAIIDPLTQLYNRRGLDEHAAVVLNHARRAAEPFFVVFIDVSGLKRVNDEFGHAVGDRLLQRVAHALHSYSRASELLCRWGGDEFVLVGLGASPDPAVLHDRLQQAIDMSDLEQFWTPKLWIGAADGSAGTHSLEHVIMLADHDMYRRRADMQRA